MTSHSTSPKGIGLRHGPSGIRGMSESNVWKEHKCFHLGDRFISTTLREGQREREREREIERQSERERQKVRQREKERERQRVRQSQREKERGRQRDR